jgi:hypothetical protein
LVVQTKFQPALLQHLVWQSEIRIELPAHMEWLLGITILLQQMLWQLAQAQQQLMMSIVLLIQPVSYSPRKVQIMGHMLLILSIHHPMAMVFE